MTKLEKTAEQNSERIGALEKLRLIVYGMSLMVAPTFALLGWLLSKQHAIAALAATVAGQGAHP